MSIRSYTSENLSSQQLLEILSTAYGYTNNGRSTPQIGYDNSLIIFPVNATGSYRYIPETNSLIIHDLNVNKETIRPHDEGWPSNSSVVLVVVWNSTKMNNGYFASAEAGCFVQNVYLAAAALELGTCCVGGIASAGLRNDLKLPSNLIPLLVMPLGYPTEPYPPASPYYDIMTGNLPPVEYSQLSFEEALMNITTAQTWAEENLSLQELSQLLWAAYGYANTTHRTTPSSWGIYPLEIFVSNASGVYLYIPQNHSVVEIQQSDRRFDIANACSSQIWAADAATIFLVVYNSAYNGGNTGDGGALPHEFIEVGSGTVIQQLFLESSAWNLSVNVISDGLEEWNGTGAEEIRNILGLSPSLIPLYIVPVGHKAGVSEHDIAVANISPSKAVVGEGYSLYVNVTVRNQGLQEETFNLTLYANSTIIGSVNSSLVSGDSAVLTFLWNTTGFAKGNYHVRASALPVLNETNTGNNELTGGWIFVTLAGDFDADHDVDIFDLVAIASSYGFKEGNVAYLPNFDMNNNGEIEIFDVVIAAVNYGKTW
jgi:hypothetical protein